MSDARDVAFSGKNLHILEIILIKSKLNHKEKQRRKENKTMITGFVWMGESWKY